MVRRLCVVLFLGSLFVLGQGTFLSAEPVTAEKPTHPPAATKAVETPSKPKTEEAAKTTTPSPAPAEAEPAAGQPLDSAISHTDVFRSGKDGYHTFRIPAIVRAKDGTLLAFAEGRKNSRSDSGDIDTVLRRSTDGGKTWGPLELVADHGEGCVGNPCPVVDQASGDIILVTIRQTPGSTEHSIREGTPGHKRIYHVQRSTDTGKTWSKPARISVLDPLSPRWVAGGPNHALQLRHGEHAGRIIVAGNHGTDNGFDSHTLHVIYSDDAGKTWRLGAVCTASKTVQPSEAAAAELPDGTILFTIRNQTQGITSPSNRALVTSRDGGQSFSGPMQPVAEITAPVCQGSILELPGKDGKENSVVISYPNDPKARKNLCIRTSTDGGKTWGPCRTIYPDLAAYSDLVLTADGHLGVLYERDNYGRITFALVQ